MGLELNMDLFGDSNGLDLFEDNKDKQDTTLNESEEEIKENELNKPVDVEGLFPIQDVVDGENQGEEDEIITDDSDSPKIYTSIAKSLFNDGFLTLDEKEIESIKTAEDLAIAFKKQADSLLDDTQKRINDALNNDVDVDEIKKYENVISYLDSINEDILKSDNEEGDTLRRNLIYQDYVNRGFKPERASKEVEKSFNAGTDIEDAIASLDSNKEFFNQEYEDMIEDSKKEKQEKINKEKEIAKQFDKRILETEEPISGLKLDKKSRNNLYNLATKFVDKDEDNKPLTALQKYAKVNPIDYQYNLNLLFYLTDGFKDLNKLIGKEVTKQTKTSLNDLERILKNPNLTSNGNYDFSNSKDSNAHKGIRFAKNA